MPLVILLPVIGYAFFIFTLVRGSAEVCLLAALTGMVGALYAFAVIDLLRPGAGAIFYLGMGLLVWGAVRGVRNPRHVGAFFRPGILVFILLCLYHYAIFGGATYFFWDEFSHWGLATKELLAGHQLAERANLSHAHYPPATALWQYFVCVNTIYSEGAAYLAHFMLLVAPLMIFFRTLAYRQWYWSGAVLLLIWFAVSCLGHGISKLYVDHLIGTTFAGLVLGYLADESIEGGMLRFFPILFYLPLIKEVGILFGVAGALFIAGHHLFLGAPISPDRRRPGRRWKRAAVIAVVCLAPAISWGSWQGWLASQGLDSPYSDTVSAAVDHSERLDSLPDAAGDRRTRVKQRFWALFFLQPQAKGKEALLFNEFSWGLRPFYRDWHRASAFNWVLCCLGAFGLLLLFARPGRCRSTIAYTFGFLMLLFAVYTYLLLKLYLDIFGPKAGLNLVSYLRYYQIVLLPLVLIAAGLYLPAMSQWYRPVFTRAVHLLFFVIVALIYIFETPYMPFLWRPAPGQSIRAAWAASVSRVQAEAKRGQSVYVIDASPRDAFSRVILHFDLSPVRTVLSPDDIGAQGPEKIEKALGGHDYVWFFSDSPAKMSPFRFLMEGEPPGPRPLFRVGRREGRLFLSPVDL